MAERLGLCIEHSPISRGGPNKESLEHRHVCTKSLKDNELCCARQVVRVL